MIGPDEVAELLAIAARYDRRTVGDEDIRGWGAVAVKDGWTFEAARRAIVEHFEASDRPIMPSHVNGILNSVRKEIRSRFTEDVCPPRELADDPRAEIEWRRQRVRLYTQDAMQAWAQGRPLPELDQRVELGERGRPQLGKAIASIAARKALPTAGRPARPAPPAARRTPRDRAILAKVREELASRGPVVLAGSDDLPEEPAA